MENENEEKFRLNKILHIQKNGKRFQVNMKSENIPHGGWRCDRVNKENIVIKRRFMELLNWRRKEGRFKKKRKERNLLY